MTEAAPTLSWEDVNQRYLTAALAEVRDALARHARHIESVSGADAEAPPRAGSPASASASDEKAETQPAATLPPPALDRLCAAFQLSSFERSILLLCAGMELDSRFAAQCAATQGDPRKTYPTFSLALAALPGAHWSALTPTAPLRHWRLIEMVNQDGLVSSPLRIDERVLHFLAGINQLDDRLRAFMDWLPCPSDLPTSQHAIAEHITRLWSQPGPAGALPVVQLSGSDLVARQAVAAAACRSARLQLAGMRHPDLPGSPLERETLSRLWEREAFLGNQALFVDADDMSAADCLRTLLPFLEDTRGILFVARREPLESPHRPLVRMDVAMPGPGEQRELWQRALGERFVRINGEVDRVITQFNLGPSAIRAASAALSAEVGTQTPGTTLWNACRLQARPVLDDLAQRIESAAAWDDLVLPDSQHQILREIAVHVRHRMQVYEAWGFAGKGSRGLGVSALFAGASGTGKTMAAEVLGAELELDVYRIDLSSVVSKYIGETEKNLRRVFDAADQGGAILLFDEADALFGKRSEVKDSHDRYANIEVSFLLQRMEAYRGLAILTTNMKEALDPAFLRRIRFVVQFPFPDTSQRAEIWRRIFPRNTPTEGVNVAKLARLNVAGGNIRNVALNAAFLAADAGEPVRMNHLLRAARSEFLKLEKPLPPSEVADWL